MFSEKLKQLRKKNKITQEQLAKMLGLERSSVAKYESKSIIPSIDTLTRIAKIFNVSIDYLIGTETPTNDSKKEFKSPFTVALPEAFRSAL